MPTGDNTTTENSQTEQPQGTTPRLVPNRWIVVNTATLSPNPTNGKNEAKASYKDSQELKTRKESQRGDKLRPRGETEKEKQ